MHLPGGGLGTSIAVGMIPEFAQFMQFKVIVEGMLAFTMDWRFCLSEV